MVMAGDPILDMIDRSKQELKAINQQIEASRTTLRSLEDTLRTMQKRAAYLEEQAAAAPGKIADAEKRATEITAAADRQVLAMRAKAKARVHREAMQLIDRAEAFLDVARSMLEGHAKVSEAA
jgi:predicted  nucleic acid-binding Zn-ribbon protein